MISVSLLRAEVHGIQSLINRKCSMASSIFEIGISSLLMILAENF